MRAHMDVGSKAAAPSKNHINNDFILFLKMGFTAYGLCTSLFIVQ